MCTSVVEGGMVVAQEERAERQIRPFPLCYWTMVKVS
jgi:hypothetical protein